MRVVLVLLVVVLVSAGTARAEMPTGFVDNTRLAAAASFVAGKPVHVYCARDHYAWSVFMASHGSSERASGLADASTGESFLDDVGCATLNSQLRRKKVEPYYLAASIETLVHESIHLRGERDEGATDCAAMHEMPRVAVKFFGVKAGKQLRALMTQAWYFHRGKTAAYTSVC